MQIIEPNIHPILVHFAFALSLTAAASYLLALIPHAARWRDTLRPAADWMLAFAALAVIATIAAGFQAYYSVAHDGPSHEAMTTHRNWAVPSGAAILLLAAWRWRQRARAASTGFVSLMTIAALSLTVTAWWGGTLVYGHGLGVKRIPVVTGEGHHHSDGGHEHGDMDGVGLEGVDASSMDMPGMDMDAHDHDHGDQATKYVEFPAEAGSPAATVVAFSAALKSGNHDAVEALLAPDAIIAEGGGAERSFLEYRDHHMPADMAFTAAVETSLGRRDVLKSDERAVVISEYQVHGAFEGKTIHARMMETVVLEATTDGWKIAHIHWSTADVEEQHEH
ncbi:DUF2231 domain-containing protein [Hyphomonas sp.]|uniref:DUF2231 domain-containing protein n=1 Tax=Hyphomonas sp. TaxID=87 RepID=UPI003D2B578E